MKNYYMSSKELKKGKLNSFTKTISLGLAVLFSSRSTAQNVDCMGQKLRRWKQ